MTKARTAEGVLVAKLGVAHTKTRLLNARWWATSAVGAFAQRG
jgi:hypothetical protein